MYFGALPVLFALVSIVAASSSSGSINHSAHNDVVMLSDGRSLIVSKLVANPDSNKWIIEVPGVSQEFHSASQFNYTQRYSALLKRGFNLAVINKPGIQLLSHPDPEIASAPELEVSFEKDSGFNFEDRSFESKIQFDSQAFDESFRHDLRLADAKTALRNSFSPKSEFFVVGTSEAAYYLPELAVGESRIKALVLLSGGTRPWLDEEIAKAPLRERKTVAKQVRRVRKMDPNSQAPWTYYPVATWRSYDEITTVPSLLKLRIPVLAIHSLDDDIIDIRSALRDLRKVASTKDSTLTMVTFFNGGHGLHGKMPRTNFYIGNLFYNPKNGLKLAIQLDRAQCNSVFSTFQYIVN